MVFRVFYANTFKDVSAHSLSRFSVGSGNSDTVSIPDSHLKKGHVTITLNDSGWQLRSKDNVYFGGAEVTQADIVLGSAIGVSEEDNVSIFAIDDFPERPTTVSIAECEELSVGSASDNGIVLKSRFISKKHLMIERRNGSYHLTDRQSTNGTYVNGTRISSCILNIGDEIILGDARIVFSGQSLEIYYTASLIRVNGLNATIREYDAPVLYKRSPRLKASCPTKIIEIAPPPPAERKPEMNWLSTLLPAFSTVGIAFIMVTFTSNMMMLIYSLPMTAMGLILSFVNYSKQKKKYVTQGDLRLEKYSEHLDSVVEEIEQHQFEQLRALEASDPDIQMCLTIASNLDRRLWQRRATDDDFLSVRLGHGQIASAADIRFTKRGLSLEEDELAARPQQIFDKYHMVDGAPITCNILRGQVCGIVGSRSDAITLLNNILLQLITHHCYTDLKLALIYDKEDAKKIEWTKSLPHTLDDEGAACFAATTKPEATELFKLFLEPIKSRKYLREAEDTFGAPSTLLPYYLFVLLQPAYLDKSNPINEYLLRSRDLSAGMIMVVDSVAQLPSECNLIIEIDQGKGLVYSKENASAKKQFSIDKTKAGDYEAFSQALKSVRCEVETVSTALPKSLSFYEMLGIDNIKHWDLSTRWSQSNIIDTMAAPLGVMESGDILELDLHEKAHGPHGLVAGTTGSGKSEVLLSFLLSLAMHYPPCEVGFVIIDFKGGGMANQLENLPHMLGAITNIEGREIVRSLAFIKAELLTRQRLFSECGVSNISDYIRKYREGGIERPMPHLLIIVDEFAELKAQQPEFMDELISAARIGRSLGIHLILATQKPAGQVNEQIWSNSKFRLCLKVASAEDSREVIKSTQAFNIKEPGRAYLQVGNNEVFELFQSGYSGVLVDKDYTQLSAAIDHIAQHCKENGIERLPSICLPALPTTIGAPSTYTPTEFGEFLLGVMDDPEQQRQEAIGLNIFRNNTLVIGTAQMGKTSLIQSMIKQTSTSYSPKEVNLYIIDLGAMILRVFENLNHVGGVVTALDTEKIKNLFKLLWEEIDHRKKLFSKEGFSSFASYRESTDDPQLAQIVVFLDNLSVFRDVFDESMEDMLLRLLREGLTYGISFVITNPQTNGISYKYLSSIATRVAFTCNDTGEYSFLFERCRMEPKNVPGRVLISADKKIYEVQAFLAFEGENEAERNRSIREFISQMNAENSGLSAKPIPSVPDHLDGSYLAENYPNIQANSELAFAIDYATVDYVSLNSSDQFILALTGRNTQAKDAFVQALLQDMEMNYYKRPVSLYILDGFERKLKNYKDAPFVLKYSNSADYLAEIMDDLLDELKDRMNQLESGDISSLEEKPWIIVVVNNKRALEALGENRDAQDLFNEISKKYSTMKILFLLSDVEDAGINSSAPTILRKIRDDKKILYFGSLKDIKLVDVYSSSARTLGDLSAEDDAFLLKREDISRVKVMQGGVGHGQ